LGVLGSRYVHRLGETQEGRQEDGWEEILNLLVHAGLFVPKGMVLSREAHREYLEQSGLLEDLQANSSGREDAASRTVWVWRSLRSGTIRGKLNRAMCDALIGLGSPSVAVVSEGLIKRHLRSIPEVKEAVRAGWLSLEGLTRQLEAASHGAEIPTWSILILAEQA